MYKPISEVETVREQFKNRFYTQLIDDYGDEHLLDEVLGFIDQVITSTREEMVGYIDELISFEPSKYDSEEKRFWYRDTWLPVLKIIKAKYSPKKITKGEEK